MKIHTLELKVTIQHVLSKLIDNFIPLLISSLPFVFTQRTHEDSNQTY